MTGRQHAMSIGIRVLGITVEMYPHSGIKITQTPPTGNWNKIESKVLYPNVETIKGPKPEIAPLIVYLVVLAWNLEVQVYPGTLQTLSGITHAAAIMIATR
jgi:hypothetical protein